MTDRRHEYTRVSVHQLYGIEENRTDCFLFFSNAIVGACDAATWVGLNGDKKKMRRCSLEVLHTRANALLTICTGWKNALSHNFV